MVETTAHVIKAVRRDKSGDITHVSLWRGGIKTVDDVLKDMDKGVLYFALSTRLTKVISVKEDDSRHIRTSSNETEADNLDNLPEIE